MASKAWADVAFPTRGTWDSIRLALNLVPLALAAAIRAAFWSLRIPLCFLDGWVPAHRRSVSWGAGEGGSLLEDKVGDLVSPGRPLEELVQASIDRGAHRFPHSHGRPFPRHLAGIAALVQHWRQPEGLCRAALLHSAYSTEMFPWGLYTFSERAAVRALIGEAPEAAVFLYCTVSQTGLYREALRLTSLREDIPAKGLSVRNCQTGEALRVPPRAAARVLVLLGADVAEQDPFFDLYLVACLVRLAAPYLDNPPPIASMLDAAGFFDLTHAEHAALCRHARSLLAAGPSADLGALEAAARKAPWLYELGVEACRRGRAGGELGRACLRWCEAWGTPWSKVVKPHEEIERVRAAVGAEGS